MSDVQREDVRPWLTVMTEDEFHRLASYNGRTCCWRHQDPAEMKRLQRRIARVMNHRKRWVDDRLPDEPWRLVDGVWQRVVKVSKGPGGHAGPWWRKHTKCLADLSHIGRHSQESDR